MQSNCGVHKKFTNRRKKDGTTEAVPSSPIFSLVGVHQIVENDFLRPVVDIVHVSHPGHGIGGFQGLGHTLSLGNLLDEIFHLFIAGGIDLIEMPEQSLGKNKSCPYAGAVFL